MNKQGISDEEILNCFKTKQADRGFKLLLDKYERRIYTQIRRVLHEHEDAKDAMQNCLVKIFRNIDRFKGQSQLYTWIYRIATNEAITISKRLQRQKMAVVSEDAQSLVASSYSDSKVIEKKLSDALALLPVKQRLVFCMRFYEDMGYKEISEVLDTSVGALKASYHHAVKKLEVILTA